MRLVAIFLAVSLLSAAHARADDPRTDLGSPFEGPAWRAAGGPDGTDAAEPEHAEPRSRLRAFELRVPSVAIGPLFGHGSGVLGGLSMSFYARLAPWAAVGARVVASDIAYASSGDVVLGGGIMLPSVRFSFREELDPVVAIECGLHLEGGYFGGGGRSSPFGGAFGLGGGIFAALDLGPSNAIVLDAIVSGWGARGGYNGWLQIELAYAVRFD